MIAQAKHKLPWFISIWGEGDYDWISIHRTMHCDWMD
jgi:hypothetical protein